jgi:glutamate N-acetyltransferase/amino-acid N-acetyltransferase
LIKGEPVDFDESALSATMGQSVVTIVIDLHSGSQSITGWGCDLSNEYIHINADYRT